MAARNIYRIVGLALSLAWSFCAFPPITVEGTLWQGFPLASQVLLRLGIVGVLPCLLIPLAPRLLEGRRARPSGAVACVLWLAGWCASAWGMSVFALGPLLFLTFVMGAGTSFYLVYWGVAFCAGGEEEIERGFIGAIVLAGLLIVGIHGLPAPVLQGAIIAIPPIEWMLLAASVRADCQGGFPDGSGGRGQAQDETAASRGLGILVVRTALAITLVSFAWCMFSMQHEGDALSEIYLFGVGFVLSGAFIGVFVKYAPSVGFVTATRWVLPIMAAGLLCNVSSHSAVLMGACLLLAMAHATFEMLLRLQVVRFARRSAAPLPVTVGWGFAAVMAGAFLGPTLYVAIVAAAQIELAHLTLWVLAVLVVLESVLFSPAPHRASGDAACIPVECPRADEEAGAPDAPQVRAARLAHIYGLTAREEEILAMLLEGRSRPYIRDALYVSISTVDTHVRHIYAKAGVHNKQELINLSLGGGGEES